MFEVQKVTRELYKVTPDQPEEAEFLNEGEAVNAVKRGGTVLTTVELLDTAVSYYVEETHGD